MSYNLFPSTVEQTGSCRRKFPRAGAQPLPVLLNGGELTPFELLADKPAEKKLMKYDDVSLKNHKRRQNHDGWVCEPVSSA